MLRSGKFLFTASLFCITGVTQCRSHGAPPSTCRSLMPAHDYAPQTTKPPYEILVVPRQIFPNQSVTVTIRVVSSRYRFKGFIIQAKETAYWQKYYHPAIGTFKFTEGTRRLDCYHGQQNTLTHSSAQHTEEVIARWLPPYRFRGRVTFIATIVATFNKFWNKVHSVPVEVRDFFDWDANED